MNKILKLSNLDQFKDFENPEKIIEIISRKKSGQISRIQKVMISDLLKQDKTTDFLKTFKKTNVNHRNLDNLDISTIELTKSFQMLKKFSENIGQPLSGLKRLPISNVGNLSLILNGVNLAATATAFVILYNKMNDIESSLKQEIQQIQTIVQDGYKIQSSIEFEKVLALYTDMMDCRRIGSEYSEQQMRKLVDSIYSVLIQLLEFFEKELIQNKEDLIVSIFTLLSMFTNSLKIFHEMYYFEHQDSLTGQDPWHSSNKKWNSIYDRLSSALFIEKLQDYAYLEANLDSRNSDLYCRQLLDQVSELKQDVDDYQILIQLINDREQLDNLQSSIQDEVRIFLENAMNQITNEFGSSETESIKEVINEQLQFI